MYLPSGSAGELLTREQRQHRYRYKVLGAVDAGRGDKAVSHWSAAALWGMPVLGGDLDRVHFTANRTGGGRDRTRACTLHATPWQPDEVIELPGLLVTTPARTAVDISRAGTFEQESARVTPRCAWERRVLNWRPSSLGPVDEKASTLHDERWHSPMSQRRASVSLGRAH